MATLLTTEHSGLKQCKIPITQSASEQLERFTSTNSDTTTSNFRRIEGLDKEGFDICLHVFKNNFWAFTTFKGKYKLQEYFNKGKYFATSELINKPIINP